MSISVRPKLVVRGADDALQFYTRVFGARLVERYTSGDVVVQAELALGEGRVLVKEEDEADPAPTTLGRPGVLLDVVTDDPDELAGIAQDNGAAVVFPVADQPYGARGGRIRDPFGHEWLLQTPLSMTPEQVQHALNEAAGG
jgi:PhnB protein